MSDEQKRMVTAHLMYGFIGSGKTTAKRLEAELPAVRFTHDEWMVALYGNDPPAERFAEYHQRVFGVMEQMWLRCLSLGVDVVLDSGLWTRQERDAVRQKVSAAGAGSRLYAHIHSDETLWNRVQQRNQNSASNLFIARNTFDVLRSRLEPLGEDEIVYRYV